MSTQPEKPKKLLSGSYQDYLNGDTANKKFKFRLLKHNLSPSLTHSTGRPRQFVGTCTFPAIGIIDELVNGKWEKRVIRYIPGEKSIYKDEQSSDDKIPKKMFNIKFENGGRTVPGTDRLLLEFFMKYNLNLTNPNRTDVTPKFELVDTDKYIKEAQAKDLASDKAKFFCREGNWEEVVALAMVLGVDTEADSDEVRWNLRNIAERDPNKFLGHMKDPKMKMKYHVLKAIEKGFLVVNHQANSVSWLTNRDQPIFYGVVGRDIIDGFVNELATVDGNRLYNAITEMIYPPQKLDTKIITPTAQEMADAIKAANPPKAMLEASSKTDEEITALIEKALKEELVTSSGTVPWLTYIGKKYKKTDALLFALKSDKAMLDAFAESLA